jgi:hypothetical protein
MLNKSEASRHGRRLTWYIAGALSLAMACHIFDCWALSGKSLDIGFMSRWGALLTAILFIDRLSRLFSATIRGQLKKLTRKEDV